MTITRRLIAAGAPAGTEIVVVPSVNPDGCSRGSTRGNRARRRSQSQLPVELVCNRAPRLIPVLRPRPLSEPESRYSVALIKDLQPQITIWFHQPQGVVRRVGTERRNGAEVSRNSRTILPEHPWPYGTAQNCRTTVPGIASFVVSCRPAPSPPRGFGVWVHAIREIAIEGVRR